MWLAVFLGAVAATVGVLLLWPRAARDAAAPLAAAAPPPAASVSAAVPAAWPAALDGVDAEPKRVALTPVGRAEPAAYSMALARQNGDPRTPPISRDEAAAAPSAAELADPKAYQGYESRQNMKLYAGYVQAADADLPALRRDIARGREAGVPAAEIAKVEEKLRRIDAMRAQLLARHPELAPR
ncbi:hypothetical protein ACFDR9_004762 [Janthinobacterium sp. CG_23.3]|uniref:hypothetical protein n=1 Tax=Janthinobacterium sp. CG_23.3 TaxID=3349634 RepID=UPI0038D4EB2A